MKKITNYAEVIDKAREIIVDALQNCYPYQTDIYLYIDEDGTATVDEFYNIGGNSGLDDEHITICKIPGNIDWFEMCYGNFDVFDLANALHKYISTLIEETIQYMDEDDDYEPSEAEIEDYIRNNDKYIDELKAVYDEWVVTDFAQSFVDDVENAIIDCLSNLIWTSWGF